jgi:hypothetical protein
VQRRHLQLLDHALWHVFPSRRGSAVADAVNIDGLDDNAFDNDGHNGHDIAASNDECCGDNDGEFDDEHDLVCPSHRTPRSDGAL